VRPITFLFIQFLKFIDSHVATVHDKLMRRDFFIYIYKRLRPRKKNPQQKKRKSRKSNFLMKLNTKPLKFQTSKILMRAGWWGRAMGGGQAGRPMQGMGTPT
jgi:hypothetical protein